MKKIFFLFSFFIMMSLQAQTIEEVISGYIETIGGDQFTKLESISMDIKQSAQGMEFTGTVYQTKDGRGMVKISVQGNELFQNVYDGETLWGTNFMTMKAEKADSETLENYRNNEAKDFPDPFIDYMTKGYSAELVGSEEIEGVDCYKVKLTKVPTLKNGEKSENISYYYFDKDSNLMIASDLTQDFGAGDMTVRNMYGDYEEFEGLVFPTSVTAYADGNEMFSMTFSNIQINPEIDYSMFAFPEE